MIEADAGVPGTSNMMLGTVAVITVEDASVEGSETSFHCTTSPCAKFLPVTIKVNPAPPATTLAGLTPETTGCVAEGCGIPLPFSFSVP
jgi:hypothetical protein